MTSNPRFSLMLTPEIDRAILELRKTDKFCASSLSEIVRYLIGLGLEAVSDEKKG